MMARTSDGTDSADEAFLASLDAAMPGQPEILQRLALVRLRLGRTDEALACAERAVTAGAGIHGAHFAKGKVLIALRRYADARASLEAATRLEPNFWPSWLALGEALMGLGTVRDEAIAAFRRAAALAPDRSEPAGHLAPALMNAGRTEEGVAAFRTAVALSRDPSLGDLLNNFGVALQRMERRDDALAVLQAAGLVRPESRAIQDNLGNALLAVGRSAEAEQAHRRALALGATAAETWSNLGNALHRQGRLDEAEVAYRRAVAAKPDLAKFHTNLALNLLLSGKFDEGWREYEWRWKDHGSFPAYLRERPWNGSALPPEMPAGGTLLLQAEQGFGDTIQFVRYVPLLKERGVTRVILACQPELMRLMRTAPALDDVIDERKALPPIDAAMTLMSLGRVFRAGLDAIPAPERYLSVPAGAGVALPPGDGGLKVGLAWAGRPTHGDDWNRSINAGLLDPVFEVPGVTFYSLQRGAVAPRIGRPPADKVLAAADLCADFADTAAVVAAMDLVISVDTAIIHLAGALGVPTWVMLPSVPDFRWQMAGDTTPWYPGLRLLRRSHGRGWEPVIRRAAAMLADLVESRAPGVP